MITFLWIVIFVISTLAAVFEYRECRSLKEAFKVFWGTVFALVVLVIICLVCLGALIIGLAAAFAVFGGLVWLLDLLI